MSTADRRKSLMAVIRSVIADKGFHGTTTKGLAEAAGVSEALLFKHFPTKDAMYAAMQEECWDAQAEQEFKRLAQLPPNTSSLVMLVYLLMNKIASGQSVISQSQPEQFQKLMLRSLLDDGVFARGILKQFDKGWITKFEECFQAATASGEVTRNAIPGRVSGWFIHDLAVMLMLMQQRTPPVANYGASRQELIDYSVRFVLQGMGLSEEAIQRHYNPAAFALLFGH